MRAVIQRVARAEVIVENDCVGRIDRGLLAFLGVMKGDSLQDADYIVKKILNIRIFEDEGSNMSLSVLDKKYGILLVSQFTICGNVKKGNRPSFDPAEDPIAAKVLYEYVLQKINDSGLITESGIFQEHMKIVNVNDGPVTILIDSKKEF